MYACSRERLPLVIMISKNPLLSKSTNAAPQPHPPFVTPAWINKQGNSLKVLRFVIGKVMIKPALIFCCHEAL